MESNFKKFINDNKGFVVFYLIWFLVNLTFFSVGEGGSGFWPFSKHYSDNDFLDDYGKIEFIFYMIAPIVIFALWKLVGKDIKKNVDKNN